MNQVEAVISAETVAYNLKTEMRPEQLAKVRGWVIEILEYVLELEQVAEVGA